jgi:hypothetical protein
LAESKDGSNKKARSEDEYLKDEKERGKRFVVNLEVMDTPMRGKGSFRVNAAEKVPKTAKIAPKAKSMTKRKGKKASFAEVASAPAPEVVMKWGFLYQKCIVGFAIRVDKGQKFKENFDKKIDKALFFLQSHIDEEACFLPLTVDKTLGPIKEKQDMPKFQVTSRKYFSIPNPQAFSPVLKDGGRVIKGSGIMGFKGDPQTCLEEAGGDLKMLNCSIFYKKCQEVDTNAKIMLLGAPNSVAQKLKQIHKVMDTELRELEMEERKDPKSPITCFDEREWVKYTITKVYCPRMPWEGIEEKKQKMGSAGARLTYIHVYQLDYEQVKTLL